MAAACTAFTETTLRSQHRLHLSPRVRTGTMYHHRQLRSPSSAGFRAQRKGGRFTPEAKNQSCEHKTTGKSWFHKKKSNVFIRLYENVIMNIFWMHKSHDLYPSRSFTSVYKCLLFQSLFEPFVGSGSINFASDLAALTHPADNVQKPTWNQDGCCFTASSHDLKIGLNQMCHFVHYRCQLCTIKSWKQDNRG